MYIPAFWCGVLTTVVFEIVALIVATLVYGSKKSKEGKE